jgi:dTDP-4-amino-4,6-dideoxygalactose transaminase
MTIHLFVPKFRTDECLAEIRECLDKGWTGLGFKTVEFEKAWCTYTGLPSAHFLSSATAGLHLALHILKTRHGWRDGDEIITTPLSFVSTNHAILYCNLKPVFAEVDQYLCLDPDDVERRLTARTRAVMFVGIGGNAGQYRRIVELCRARGLRLILDAAHMSGTRVDGRHVGHDADCAVFSFQAVKNLPTADSGMICFPEPEDDARARKLTWLGINKDTYTRTSMPGPYKWMYDVEEVGFKYHGNSIMAAIGLVQLRYLDEDNAYRRQLAAWYGEQLGDGKSCGLIPVSPGCESSRHLFQVLVKNRVELISALHAHDIYPGVHYRDNTEYGMYAPASCPGTRRVSSQVLSLPMHLRLQRSDVVKVAEVVRKHSQWRA